MLPALDIHVPCVGTGEFRESHLESQCCRVTGVSRCAQRLSQVERVATSTPSEVNRSSSSCPATASFPSRERRRHEETAMTMITAANGRDVKHYIIPLNTNMSVPPDPVLVTAFDHTHFWEGVALWTMYGRRLQHQYQLIIYDLGLHAWQRHLVRHFFKFPFRIFNFNKYPAHVRNLKNYAFKAAVIQETLQEFGHVFWVDTSFRLQGNGSLDAYVQANKAHAGLTVWHIDGLRQACFIHQGMLDFFDERAKDFVESPANEGGAILVYNYPATYRAIMLPWLVCSLVEKCISPKGAILTPCDFSNKFTSKHCCHRYDQSAMGLILERVFHFDTSLYNSSTTRIHTFDRV
ncbi:PREDICTED: uncharacterized protein LOC106814813 [Priapulus caudatus]|uniref:Uncharacterized protein LOC106814813 n=1 Tax=Priapulus caudatus TaxID=37621 RepID=A0ABM1ER30_PRICU|nr:PREDICTED: uncharacterized protein LOC106814813 [Priapulus caudatus]